MSTTATGGATGASTTGPSTGAGSGASPAASTATGGAATTTASTAASGAPEASPGAAPAGGAAPAATPKQEQKKKGAEAALERARERIAKTKAGGVAQPAPATTSTPTSEQAPASGASTPAAGDTTGTPAPTAGKEGTAPAAAQPDSTVSAPKDWPEAMRSRFEKLPNEARDIVLSFQKDMQRGFTHATQKISQIETQHKEAIDTAKQFRDDPKATLTALAKRAGIPIFFEAPAATGEIPEFKTPADMAKWVAEQVATQVRAEQERAAEATKAETRKRQAMDSMRAALTKAAQDHADFATHKDAVFQFLEQNALLEPEHAYRLATYDGLMTLAKEGEAAKRELATLKTTIDNERKRATVPTQGAGTGKPKADDSHLSAGQRALERAKARRAGVAR